MPPKAAAAAAFLDIDIGALCGGAAPVALLIHSKMRRGAQGGAHAGERIRGSYCG